MLKCIACGEEVVPDENENIKGGCVTITFHYGSKYDTEIWKGYVHDGCARIVSKFMNREESFI